ncbi:MAG TPA: hypothetical protein VGL06_02830 [Pseudonocardiaceae bacterium]|jgi:hypothetical protein
MTMLMLQLLPVSTWSPAHSQIVAAAPTGQGTSSFLVIAVLVAVAIIVVLAKMLRGMMAMIAPLVSSAGAAFLALIGVSALLITTVLTVFTR